MGDFLLSIASPDTLSWTGFVGLIIALIGEAAVYVVSKKWEWFHREAAFAFAVLAAGAYTVERVGDDAIISGLKQHSERLESELKAIKKPRSLTSEQRQKLVEKLKQFEKQQYFISVATGKEPADFLCSLDDVLAEAGWVKIKPSGPLTTNIACGEASFNGASGVRIIPPVQPPGIVAAEALADELIRDGFSARTDLDPKNNPSPEIKAIIIAVGIKP